MAREHDAEYLIVGQGLAGTLLALALIERDRRVLVADPGGGGASRVAAGLLNPITGQRLTRAADLERLLPAAHQRLTAIGGLLERPVHRETPILRHLCGDRPHAAWQRRRRDPAFAAYLAPGPEPETLWIRGGAVVDTAALLGGVAAWLEGRGALLRQAVDPGEVGESADGVWWRHRRFDRVVFCEGARLPANPWFPGAGLRPVKGQVLEGWAPVLPDHPVHRRWTLVPLDAHRFRVGATYDRDAGDDEPTAEGRRRLASGLAELLPDPGSVTVTGHRAGWRPTTPDGLPLLGRHPARARIALFNGLGSKGLLLGPHYADRFAAALAEDGPEPAEAVWTRFGGGP